MTAARSSGRRGTSSNRRRRERALERWSARLSASPPTGALPLCATTRSEGRLTRDASMSSGPSAWWTPGRTLALRAQSRSGGRSRPRIQVSPGGRLEACSEDADLARSSRGFRMTSASASSWARDPREGRLPLGRHRGRRGQPERGARPDDGGRDQEHGGDGGLRLIGRKPVSGALGSGSRTGSPRPTPSAGSRARARHPRLSGSELGAAGSTS